jgi:hypothetical protein
MTEPTTRCSRVAVRVLWQLLHARGLGETPGSRSGGRGGASCGAGRVPAYAEVVLDLRVVALSHGRRKVELIDAPCFRPPVQVVW